MNKILVGIFFSLLVGVSFAQPVVMVHENCEPPSGADTLICGVYWTLQDSVPFPNLASNHYVRSKIIPVTSVYLEVLPIVPDTSLPYFYFEFDHICKVDFLDIAQIQYHTCLPDTVPWRAIPSTYYLGSGNYNGSFGCATYGLLWQPASPTAIPTSAWWRHEIFDLTQLILNNGLNNPFLLRFRLTDAGTPGANNNYGWLIDNGAAMASSSPVGIPDTEDQPIDISSDGNTISIQNTDYQKVELYDELGRLVLQSDLHPGFNQINPGQKGYFIVRFIKKNRIFSRKIVLVY